jgi:Holliday junction resolvasome RuvABC endonuclease subunit
VIILGLDASSTTIGISIIKVDDPLKIDWTNLPLGLKVEGLELVHSEYYKPPKKGNIFVRLQAVRNFIQQLAKKWNPDIVVLEEILLYMPNKSTAKTISTLAILNRTVGLAILDQLERPPELLSVNKIRHATKLGKKQTQKEDVPELVAGILGIEFPWEFNRKDKPKVENYDRADGINVALAWIKIQQPKIKKTKQPKTKKN